MSSRSLRKQLETTYEDALARLPEALQAEGFGVLTEIDFQKTLKQKLGVDFRRYKVLGACNPPFAHQALSADLEIGLLMPCNVAVYEDDEGKAVVVAVDPVQTMAAGGDARMQALAEQVRGKLSSALDRL